MRKALNVTPEVAASLAIWHDGIKRLDLSRLPEIVHPDAVFRSPMAHTAYGPAPALIMVLGTVIQVFENFTYHREFASDDGLSVVLEFSANVGDKKLKGIDMIQFDTSGKITDFEVMVRPFSGLQALGTEMGKRLGHLLPGYKA